MHELLTRPTADLYRSLVAQTSSRVATRFDDGDPAVLRRGRDRTCSNSSTASPSTPTASGRPGAIREIDRAVPRARRLVPRPGVRGAPQLPGRAACGRRRGHPRGGEHVGRHLRPVDGRHAHGTPAPRRGPRSASASRAATASSPRVARSRTCTHCSSPARGRSRRARGLARRGLPRVWSSSRRRRATSASSKSALLLGLSDDAVDRRARRRRGTHGCRSPGRRARALRQPVASRWRSSRPPARPTAA